MPSIRVSARAPYGAGLEVKAQSRYTAPAPSEFYALAGSAHPIHLRRLPPDAAVHASVDMYLRAHPEYWRRLPARVVWSDRCWADRSERLVQEERSPAAEPAMMVAAAS